MDMNGPTVKNTTTVEHFMLQLYTTILVNYFKINITGLSFVGLVD